MKGRAADTYTPATWKAVWGDEGKEKNLTRTAAANCAVLAHQYTPLSAYDTYPCESVYRCCMRCSHGTVYCQIIITDHFNGYSTFAT